MLQALTKQIKHIIVNKIEKFPKYIDFDVKLKFNSLTEKSLLKVIKHKLINNIK